MAIRLPTAQSVPTVDPGIARDPGLQVPAAAFGAAEAAGVEQLGSGMLQVADRIATRNDVVAHARSRSAYQAEVDQRLREIEETEDLSNPAVLQAFGEWSAQRQSEILGEAPMRLGAKARLAADLQDLDSRYTGQLAAKATQAGRRKVIEALDSELRPLVTEVTRDPSSLTDYLNEAEQTFAKYEPGIPDEQRQQAHNALRDMMAEAAIEGAMSMGDLDSAEAILNQPGMERLISAPSRIAFERRLNIARGQEMETERQLAMQERQLAMQERQMALAGMSDIEKAFRGRMRTAQQYGEGSQEVRAYDRMLAAEYGDAGFKSNVGKTISDRLQLVAQFGAESEQVQQFDRLVQAQQRGTRFSMTPGGGFEFVQGALGEPGGSQSFLMEGLRRAPETQTMVRDIGRAFDLMKDESAVAPAYGPFSPYLVPGTNAYELNLQLDAVKARLGFAALQKMRSNSPTGGALGQVSERENILLQSQLGQLDIRSQYLPDTLNQINELYLDAWYGSPSEQMQAIQKGLLTEEQVAALNQERVTQGMSVVSAELMGIEGEEPQVAGQPQQPGAAVAAPLQSLTPGNLQFTIQQAVQRGMTEDQALQELANRYGLPVETIKAIAAASMAQQPSGGQ